MRYAAAKRKIYRQKAAAERYRSAAALPINRFEK